MKKIIAFLLIICYSSGTLSLAQSAFGRYSSKIGENGVCYFFKNRKLKDVSGIKRFEYDMTYPDWTDSVTINFSMYCKEIKIPEQFAIATSECQYESHNLRKIYVDITKGGYEIRMTSMFSYKDVCEAFNSNSPLAFMMQNKGDTIWAEYNKHSWKKECEELGRIFKLIETIK